MFTTDETILLFALLLFAAVLSTKFASKFGLPYLVFFIGAGLVLGNYVFFSDTGLTQTFGTLALIVILFNGGMQTKWKHIRKVIAPSLSMATIGVVLTTAVVGTAAKLMLNIGWLEGMLLGAIVGSTDAAAVFAVLGNRNIRRRLTSTLEAESGTNDPMAVFLTVSLIELIEKPDTSVPGLLLNLTLEIGIGLVVGVVIGIVAVRCINKINLDVSGLYPVAVIAFGIFSYSLSAYLHGSGLLSVYIAALYIGNQNLMYRFTISRFNEGFAWMMQILMFVMMGLLAYPQDLLGVAWQGLLLAAILLFIARPIGVFASTFWMKFSFKETLFLSWAGLKGAVPIVLATYPLLSGLEFSRLFFNIVFFIVLISALVQGPTMAFVARKLGLEGPVDESQVQVLDAVPVGKANMEIIEMQVDRQTGAAEKRLKDLHLPEGTLVTSLIRKQEAVPLHDGTRLHDGDLVYIFTSKTNREKVKAIFSEGGTDDS
ncbi:potassium/proton antiporter [Paenibacillus beijingensis]|uniref:Potassium transporter n=1 Tax=Paenibacillus beijingensis TaxID=1126833 RepID=A0A0D5NQ61_9BACL|nr:potassium/proton antiporter [Paenibacillus beijingensis]AJY77305.1 potassium transporter [Paenibacillus beijingensis]